MDYHEFLTYRDEVLHAAKQEDFFAGYLLGEMCTKIGNIDITDLFVECEGNVVSLGEAFDKAEQMLFPDTWGNLLRTHMREKRKSLETQLQLMSAEIVRAVDSKDPINATVWNNIIAELQLLKSMLEAR